MSCCKTDPPLSVVFLSDTKRSRNLMRLSMSTIFIMSSHIISCHLIYHITSHIMSHQTTSYHIISYHIISNHIISYQIIFHHIPHVILRVISYHVISYHILSCHIVCYHVFLLSMPRYKHTCVNMHKPYLHHPYPYVWLDEEFCKKTSSDGSELS